MRAARNPGRRDAVRLGAPPERVVRNYWTAEWTGDASPVKAIAAKLLADPDLAHEVYKILASKVINDYQKKRRSEAKNSHSGPASRVTHIG